MRPPAHGYTPDLGSSSARSLARAAIIARVTLVEVTYELPAPLGPEQLRALGNFANTYGLRRFRMDEERRLLSIEYDASRLRETEVAHVLGQARIGIVRRVNPAGS